MRFPNFSQERSLLAQGFRVVAGVDEVGRGAWAGPLVAGAVVLRDTRRPAKLRDSKLLTARGREHLYERVLELAVAWAVGVVSVDEIDTVGLGEANRLALERAVLALEPPPDFVLVDAFTQSFPQSRSAAVPKGDARVVSIAAASIIAKVTRDRMLRALAEQFPAYGFEAHKGYGTRLHQRMLKRHGVSPLHRRSFAPVRRLLG